MSPPISQSINFDMSKYTVTNFSEKMKILNHLRLEFPQLTVASCLF